MDTVIMIFCWTFSFIVFFYILGFQLQNILIAMNWWEEFHYWREGDTFVGLVWLFAPITVPIVLCIELVRYGFFKPAHFILNRLGRCARKCTHVP